MQIFKILETSYENFDSTMRNFLSKTFGELGQYYSKSNIFGTIFEGIKGVVQNVMFYIEDAVTEQNVLTAIRKKSIISLAKLSGYETWTGSPATGTISIYNIAGTTLSSGSTSLYIPDKTILVNSATNIRYTIILQEDNCYIDLSKPLINYDFKIVQGVYKKYTYTAKGEPIETFEISLSSLWSKDYIDIYVNGNKCTIYDCFYDMTGSGYECVIQVGYNSNVLVMFGDDTYGKQLEEGDIVTIDMLTHSGESGNIKAISSTTAFKFYSTIYDGFGNDIIGDDYLKIKVTNYICGGSDEDTFENIKNMIGYNSRSLVIASEDNFKLFLSRFSFVGQSTIYSEQNSLYIIISCIKKQSSTGLTALEYIEQKPDDILLSDDQKNMIKQAFNTSNKSFAGLSLDIEDPIIRQYALSCYIKVDSSYNKTQIKTKIKNVIAEYFTSLATNTTFIAKSDIINHVLNNTNNIDSFDIDIISKDNEEGYATGYWYKEELKCTNGIWKHINTKQIYSSSDPVGLDMFGNIQVSDKLEIPILHGGFKYYPNKDTDDTSTSLTTETIQFHFI